MPQRKIELRNVRVNNLKDIDLDIPHGQWLSVCGLSGSGKTSLALDTLYAEGQRRYIESFSPYTRQFLQQLDRPDADQIDGIPPAIAVKATRGRIGPYATVGSATETIEYLRLLFSKIADVVCPNCNVPVSKDDPESVAESLAGLPEGTRFQIGFMVDLHSEPLAALESVRKNGFGRMVIGGQTVELSSALIAQPQFLDEEQATVIVDRLKSDSPVSRIRESLETAFRSGNGQCLALIAADEVGGSVFQIDGRSWQRLVFSRELKCGKCEKTIPNPTPRLLSFSSPLGACHECEGLGEKKQDDVVSECKACKGTRLNEHGLSFRISDKNITELSREKIYSLLELFEDNSFDGANGASRIVNPIVRRLRYLCQVGLGYLSLDRPLRTLSGGEAQRISLTTSLSSTLVNMLYVLDEPSIGLHPHDIGRLKTAIAALHRRGNTLVVVDHEEQIIRAAERVIEIGPAAGESGGEIVFDGTPDEIVESESLTGDYLAGRRGVSAGGPRRKPRGRIKLVGAHGKNLQNLDVEFPLGNLCVVTGVSGAGKSSLVQKTLYGALCQRKNKNCDPPLPFGDVFGDSSIEEVILIDQSPIGRSARSNPLTYVKTFDDIRKTFAETMDAKTKNLKASHFSFNVAGGRCDKCEGDGSLTIDMQFLSDIVMKCDQCRGTRFRDEVLAVRYRGKNIAEVLEMTVRQAFSFFRGQPKVQAKLKNLIDVGLEYIRLGQPATKLSTGEAQRLKLALYLNANRQGRSLFILDEPTTGLHMNDVVRLLDCLDALLDVGHSMIIVEHNLQLIKHADWIIDLGPGAADSGGRIVVSGTPEQVAENQESLTGQYLKPLLELVADE